MGKEFTFSITGVHKDLIRVVQAVKALVSELESEGAEFEHAVFSSGHLLGGSRSLNDFHEEKPLVFADGEVHPVKVEFIDETSLTGQF